MRYPGFINGSYTGQNRSNAIERTVNFYPERHEHTGEWSLCPTPGLVQFGGTPTENPVRGIWEGNGRVLVVVGGQLEERLADGTRVTRGSVANDNRTVSFSWNGNAGGQVAIASAGLVYVFTLDTSALTGPVVSENIRYLGFLDGFIVGLDTATSTLRMSNLNNASIWSAGKIAQRNVGADDWSSMLVTTREIWLFGTRTTEVWENQGGAPVPFGPIQGAFVEQGIAAPDSAAVVGGAPMWLGQSSEGASTVLRAEGWRGVRVSNHALEWAIEQMDVIEDAIGWSYERNGHTFYVLEFPTEGQTWALDLATGRWCERSTWDAVNGLELPWRARYHVYAFKKHLVGDRSTGRVFEMSDTIGTDAGGIIRRVRRAPHIKAELNRITYHEFKLDLQTGVGAVTGQGTDPTIMLRYSDDAGETFGNELWRSAGRSGQRSAVAQWPRLGMARSRVFEVAFTDPVPWRITDAYLRLTVNR